MLIKFPYPDFPPLEIEERNFLRFSEPPATTSPEMPHHTGGPYGPQDILEKALANPLFSPRLSQLAKGKRNVVIAVDDYTRTTPAETALPLVLDELNCAGLADEAISIILAGGSHRPMTDEEIERKLGPEIRCRFKVLPHDREHQGQLVIIGNFCGCPLEIRKEAARADLIVGIGHITPHGVAGFSGGAKIIFPGVSGSRFTSFTHWLSVEHPQEEILGKRDNPVRSIIDKAAALTSLKFIVNTISDAGGNLAGAVAGDPVRAHRQGAEISLKTSTLNLPCSPDILVTCSFPADADLWQAAKAMYTAEACAKQGGVVIWVTPATEGIPGRLKAQFLAKGYLSLKQAQKMYERGEVGSLLVHAHLARVGRLVRDKARTIIVSPSIDPDEAEQMGLIWAREPQEALERAFTIVRRDSTVGVIRRGGEIVPVVEG